MKRVSLMVLGVLGLWSASAAASDRHFAFTYESAVLPAGKWELEPWNTFSLGRDGYYARLDTRLEAELGLTDRLQTSLYLNLSSETADTPAGRESHTRIEGVSSEWKLKLADPVADPVGLALYGEVSGGTTALELEGKLILDKRLGRLLVAANLAAEQEWESEEPGASERETTLEVSAAAAYLLTPSLSAGLELRSHTVLPPENEPTRSALFLGPSLWYKQQSWWITLSVLPQLHALAGASRGGLDLAEHERVEARFVFGLEF
jgi:hypothetical protein